MTIHKSRSFKRLDQYSQNTINIAINKLKQRYDEYRKQGIVITNLFGDDVIIHDIIDNKFYVYKCRARNVQVRLLYEITNKGKVNVIDYHIKNNDNALKSTVGRYQSKYLTAFSKSVNQYKNERSYAI